MACYCVVNRAYRSICDFCNGYRHPTVPELHCPRAMKEVAEQLGVTTVELVKLPGEEIRAKVDTTPYREEVEERYPAAVAGYKLAGVW